MKRKTFTIGGIHPKEHKDASLTIELLPLPEAVTVPLAQHIGAPAVAEVKPGDAVARGQLIATSPSFVSASLRAPISGTVKAVRDLPGTNGVPVKSIVIAATEDEHRLDTEARESYWESIRSGAGLDFNPAALTGEEIRNSIKDAGVVGMGGAAFPSHVKLTLKPGQRPEVLIINACECEPYLTCDDALMNAFPEQIVAGIELVMKAVDAPKAVIGIEDNKPEAIRKLTDACLRRGKGAITVQPLKTKYPQGGEKQLIEAITGRRLPSGALPISVGTVVSNVATIFAAWQAVMFGTPLIERVVTVTGEGTPADMRRNWLAALGTPIGMLPGIPADEAKIIVGGPMMGRTAINVEGPVVKGTSGITVLPPHKRKAPQPCLRCAACVQACPMGLEPYLLSRYGQLHMWEEAKGALVADCLECGACSYSCPSSRPLLDFIRLAKQRARNI